MGVHSCAFCFCVEKMKILKTYPLTFCCVVLIWYLCLFNPPKTNLDNISNIDKLVHVCMYLGTMSLFWVEYWRSGKYLPGNPRYALPLFGIVFPIMMSGVIEIVQEYCTDGRRSGDVLDFLANSLGVLLAVLLGRTILKYWFARK